MAHYIHYIAATGLLLILLQMHLTGKEHGGLMAQFFHFLGKQGIHLALQGANSPLSAVEYRTWRQHRRRLQAAQTAKTVTAATITKQETSICITVCEWGANSAIVGGCCLLPTEIGPIVCCEDWCWSYSVRGASSRNAAGPGVPLCCVRLRSNVLGTQSLHGFGSGEGDRSKESLGRVLKLGLHT